MKLSHEPDFFSRQITQARRFYLQKTKSGTGRIEVICGGCEHTTPDYEIDRKDFPYYAIEFVAKGFGTVLLNNCQYSLKPGSLFSYGKGISQKISVSRQQPMVKYFVDFSGKYAEKIFGRYLSPPGTSIHLKQPDEIGRIWDQLLVHGCSDSQFSSQLCSIVVEYLLFRIAEMTAIQAEKPSRALLTYQKCHQYIGENFLTLHSLNDISKTCLIDKSYLCRLFNRFNNQGPYQYLISLKMAYAANRFHETDLSVKEVAYEVGFRDPFHFTRSFKKKYGISPKSFRQLR